MLLSCGYAVSCVVLKLQEAVRTSRQEAAESALHRTLLPPLLDSSAGCIQTPHEPVQCH